MYNTNYKLQKSKDMSLMDRAHWYNEAPQDGRHSKTFWGKFQNWKSAEFPFNKHEIGKMLENISITWMQFINKINIQQCYQPRLYENIKIIFTSIDSQAYDSLTKFRQHCTNCLWIYRDWRLIHMLAPKRIHQWRSNCWSFWIQQRDTHRKRVDKARFWTWIFQCMTKYPCNETA